MQTAAVSDQVLGGIVRGHVLEACASLGLTSHEQAPDPRLSHTWHAAFLTNWCDVMASIVSAVACGPKTACWHVQPADAGAPVLCKMLSGTVCHDLRTLSGLLAISPCYLLVRKAVTTIRFWMAIGSMSMSHAPLGQQEPNIHMFAGTLDVCMIAFMK